MDIKHVVAAVIRNEEGRLLLAQRRDDQRFANKWHFVGGKMEPLDQTPQQALAREVWEEIRGNLDIPTCEWLCERFLPNSDSLGCGWRINYYHCHLLNTTLVRPVEVKRLMWVTKEELKYFDFIAEDGSVARDFGFGDLHAPRYVRTGGYIFDQLEQRFLMAHEQAALLAASGFRRIAGANNQHNRTISRIADPFWHERSLYPAGTVRYGTAFSEFWHAVPSEVYTLIPVSESDPTGYLPKADIA